MTLQKAVQNAVTGVVEYLPLDANEIADLQARQAANATAVIIEQQKSADEAAVVAAMPEKGDVTGAKTITELAAQVAKQGELLALIAAKLGLT